MTSITAELMSLVSKLRTEAEQGDQQAWICLGVLEEEVKDALATVRAARQTATANQ